MNQKMPRTPLSPPVLLYSVLCTLDSVLCSCTLALGYPQLHHVAASLEEMTGNLKKEYKF